MMSRKIQADYVYTGLDARPLRNGIVEIAEDGTVISVTDGSNQDAGEYVRGAIVPGFVNAHCHLELSYMKGKFSKGSGMAGFIDQINALRDTVTLQEKKQCISDWMETMWKRGVSAMADISNCDDSFEAKRVSPMYTRTFLEVFGTEPEECGKVMSGVAELKKTADSYGLDAAPTPHACYTTSPELLTAVSGAALESGFLSYHSEESPEEEEMLISGSGPMYDNRIRAGMSVPPVTGKSSLMYFIDRLALAHPAPYDAHILLVHEVCMDREGTEAVKKVMRHPYVALCPCSNIFIHNALPDVRMLASSGIRLTVGTDSLSSNDDLDMVRELFCLQENFPDIPLGEMIIWATANGADFLGREDMLGSIAPGKKPGIVAIENLADDGRLTTASRSYRIV